MALWLVLLTMDITIIVSTISVYYNSVSVYYPGGATPGGEGCNCRRGGQSLDEPHLPLEQSVHE